jgi:hypothetical protein
MVQITLPTKQEWIGCDRAIRVSSSTETKSYGKSATVGEDRKQETLPIRHFFGKDSDERSRVFNALYILVSPTETLFSGKLSFTALAGWQRASP